MHDIDRTQRELELEGHELGHEQELEHEHEQEHEQEGILGSLFGEAEHEHEQEQEHEHEQEHEYEHEGAAGEAEHEQEAESPLNEAQEMELASELLEVSNDAELEYFLGRLARAAVRGVKGFVRSPGGKMLGRMFKGFVKKALPFAGTAVGGFFGGPLGAKIGGGLGRVATNLFELELEGLSHEDREFEMARQVVRFGAASMNRAAQLRRLAPNIAARRAFTAAARVYAPGLLRRRPHCRACAANAARRRRQRGYTPSGSYATNGSVYSNTPDVVSPGPAYAASTRSGRWVRRGRSIVLIGF